MTPTPAGLLTHYQYDALDRLVIRMDSGQPSQHRFYQQSRLATEVQGLLKRQVFQHTDLLLAEHHGIETERTSLLVTDKQRSVLQTSNRRSAYTPYGYRVAGGELAGLLGFSGEPCDTTTGHYLLGNGHRAFNPALMRFNSPDKLSPFEKGGLNSYAYCGGDPINRADPSGKSWHSLAWFANGAMGFLGDYGVPLIPKTLARRIPFVANPSFGKTAKAISQVGGFSASVLYLVLNRVEAADVDSTISDSLFAVFLVAAAFGTLGGAGTVLHKLASSKKPPPLLQTQRSRSYSLPNMSPDFGSRLPESVSNTNLQKFNLRQKFDQGYYRKKPLTEQASSIRNPFRRPSL